MIKDFSAKKEEIEELGLNAISEFFNIKPNELDKDTLHFIHDKAKLAMQFEREINISKRAVELNYIRVFRMVAEDKKELKKYIQKAMPKYLAI